MAEQGNLTRRSFLVRIGATILGTYILPTFGLGTATEMTEGQEQGLPVRKLFSPPIKGRNANGFFLLWMEDRDGECNTRIWMPENDRERAEAQRFYDDCRRLKTPLLPANPLTLPPRSAEEQALICACHNKPDDKNCYLEYARYLEGRGDTRGEFARLWIEIDDFSEDDPRWDETDSRMTELLDSDAKEWFQPLMELGLDFDIFGTFVPAAQMSSMGFLQEVEILRNGIIPDRAIDLFYHAPLLRQIKFDYENLDFEGIASCPQMAKVTHLDFGRTGMTGAGLQALARSPHLLRLRKLDLSNNPLGAEAGAILAASPLLSRLCDVNLEACSLGSEGLRAPCAAPIAGRLTSLNLEDNRLAGSDLAALAAAPLLKRLTALVLRNNNLNAQGIRALQAAPFLQTLTSLDLSNCNLDTQAACAIACLPLANLTALHLGHNQAIAAQAARALASSPTLFRLQQLDLSYCKIGESGMKALTASPILKRITELKLSGIKLGDRGLRLLLDSSYLGNLTELDLSGNRLGADAAEAVAMSPALADLTSLNLGRNPFGLEGAVALSKSPYLKKLRYLYTSVEEEAGKKALSTTFGDAALFLPPEKED